MRATLVADIGGSKSRFALVDAAGWPEAIRVIENDTVADLETAVARYLEETAARPQAAIFAIAGPIEGEEIALTNRAWRFRRAQFAERFGFSQLRIVNDFEAIAWALLKFTPDHLTSIGAGRAQPGRVMVALGPGTGLGLAAMIPGEPNRVIATEGGHANLAGSSEREDAVIAQMRRKIGRVSVERAMSGPGLQNLYGAIAELDHADVPPRSAAEISQSAIDGSCPVSKAALDMFCAMLGTIAGDAALLFRARGGVYLAGGILPRIIDYVAQSEFRTRFEAKGRMRGYLETIPTSIVIHTDPAFLGLIAAIESERAAPPIQA
jgi:glucokinase